MTIHALVPQFALFVLSYSKCKIAKIFWGFASGPHWGGLTSHPSFRLPSCTTVFLLARLVGKPAPPLLATLIEKPAPPPKIAGYGTGWFLFSVTSCFLLCYFFIFICDRLVYFFKLRKDHYVER